VHEKFLRKAGREEGALTVELFVFGAGYEGMVTVGRDPGPRHQAAEGEGGGAVNDRLGRALGRDERVHLREKAQRVIVELVQGAGGLASDAGILSPLDVVGGRKLPVILNHRFQLDAGQSGGRNWVKRKISPRRGKTFVRYSIALRAKGKISSRGEWSFMR